ncbi:MAG: hypothetical protein A2W23_06870 [Planctomycetes bacterium RBG_16_43_13]|nr:MAG: hypothetical protein A2W23_06870 [Planctomycetes bacterium RBG_16_43_13]
MFIFRNLKKAVDLYAKKVRKGHFIKLCCTVEQKKREGKYPYEGKWLTTDEITRLQVELKKKDRVIFCEILSLYIFLSIIILGSYWLMVRFLIPR